MQEPYEILLGHMKDHVIVGKFLQEDIPDFSNIWTEAMPSLSSGERIMMEVALALFNGGGTASISDVFRVDKQNQGRIMNALTVRLSQLSN